MDHQVEQGIMLNEKPSYAGFWIRFCAYLIDAVIIGIPLSIINFIIFSVFFGTSDAFSLMMNDPAFLETGEMSDAQAISFLGAYFAAIGVSFIINFVLATLYYALLQSSKWQGTIGKKLLGLKVQTVKGERMSFWLAFGRYAAATFLSGILLIGYIIAAFTDKKQSLHDLIASTVVVKK